MELFGKTLTPQSYEVLKRMGSIIEFPTFYEHMTGYENLKLHAEYMGYYQHGSIEHALELLQLADAGGTPVKNYYTWNEGTSGDCKSGAYQAGAFDS